MRLLIGDKFFESLIKLPRATQKKVIDFQKKFRANPKSAAIHLESISSFDDEALRTARIDKKYRAIIGSIKGKQDYYLLWVDNHDEAVAWAQHKTFEWNSITNSPQLYTIEEGEKEAPPEPATASGHSSESSQKAPLPVLEELSREEILQLGVPHKIAGKVKEISGYADLEQLEKSLPEEAFEHLFNLIDGQDFKSIMEEIRESASEDKGDSPAFKRFYIEADDELLESVINGELEKWSLFLHPSQQALVSTDFNGSVKVTGGAGTGKTVAALHRLSYLSKQYGKHRNILFLTYTNALKKNLEKQVKALQIPDAHYELSTIDAAAHKLAQELGLIDKESSIIGYGRGFSSLNTWERVLEDEVSHQTPDFLNEELTDVIYFYNLKERKQYLRQTRYGRGVPASRKVRMEVWKLYEKYKEYKAENNLIDREELFNKLSDYLNSEGAQSPYEHVILDEVQDCSNIELRFIRSLVATGPNDLFLVGDPYQSIYSRRINFTQAGINIRGRRSKKLKVNYRTTEEIKRYAMSAIEGVRYEDFDGKEESLQGYLSLFHGQKPRYEVFESETGQHEFILNTVKELLQSDATLKPSDIVIATRLQAGFKNIITSFHQQKTAYYNLRDGVGNENGVHFCTFHSLKGLEYKVVILANINDRSFPFKPADYNRWSDDRKERHLKSEKSLMYTAMTRAIAQLYLTGVGVAAGDFGEG